MMLTVEDAEKAGCCEDGIEEFTGDWNITEMTIKATLLRSRYKYRRYVIQTICYKMRCSRDFHKFLTAPRDNTDDAYDDAYDDANYDYDYDAKYAADVASERANSAAAEYAPYASTAYVAELNRQDKWLIDRWYAQYGKD